MRILVTGASGNLGAYVLDALRGTDHERVAWSGRAGGERSGVTLGPIDLLDCEAIRSRLDQDDPDAVVHLAAVSAATEVRRDLPKARAVNVEATGEIASWCARRDRRLVFSSTDLVFDGSRSWNREDDPAEPILAYGRTKREAERLVLSTPGGLVARLPLMFGPSRCGKPGFFDGAMSDLRRGSPRSFFADEFRSPLDYATAAAILVHLVPMEVAGTLHVAGVERVSRFDLMRRSAAAMGLDASLVRPSLRGDAPGAEPRPADVSLSTERLAALLPGIIRPRIEEVDWTLASRAGLS